MLLYGTVILLSDVLILVLNGFLRGGEPSAFGSAAAAAFGGTLLVIAIDGAFAFLIRRLPEKWFAPGARIFRVGKKERAFFGKLGVRRWKHLVPELGALSGFRKDHIGDTRDRERIGRFLLESNYGVVIHLENALCGLFLPLFPFLRPFAVWFPVFFVNLFLHLLPAVILRYNTPPLWLLFRRSGGEVSD